MACLAGKIKKDIDEAIEITVANEKDADREIGFLKRIVNFGDLTVKQIMKSRVDVISVDFRTNYNELVKVVVDSGYSRIPVFDEDFDNIVGVLYVKELLEHIHKPKNFEWQGLIRTNIMYVPESKKIADLLREFQSQRVHMGIVVDEYGGSSGIVFWQPWKISWRKLLVRSKMNLMMILK